MRWICLVVFVTLSFMTGCGRTTRPPEAPEQKDLEPQVYVGLASYYGAEFNGRTTASGDTYDPTQMTAAHRTLPFGTRVLVTNLENNRSVLVTITDRGPQKPDRIIDVSFNAATELMMLPAGVVKVRVEVVNE